MTHAEKNRMLRNAAWIVVQRAGLTLGALLYAMVIPRLMGPHAYGQFALIVSLSIWFFVASDLGISQIIVRYVPPRLIESDMAGIRKLFGSLLTSRVLTGIVSIAVYIPVARLAVREAAWADVILAGIFTLVWCVSDPVFALCLGLNQAARWGASPLTRRWLLLILVSAGFAAGGLTGALAGVVVTELAVLGLGIFWNRTYFLRECLKPDFRHLAPYLAFGLTLFASGLLQVTFRQSGELLVRLFSGDYAQVAFYGLSFSAFLAAEASFTQLFQAFIPFLSALASRRQLDEIRTWAERILRGFTVVAVPVTFGAGLLARYLAPLVFGRAYQPVAINLVPMSFMLLALVPGSVASLLAVALEQPRIALASSAVRWLSFWTVAPLLIRWYGSFGACIGALTATILSAAYFTRQIRRHCRYTLRKWVTAVAPALLALPLTQLATGFYVSVTIFVLLTAAYGGLMFLLKVITPYEIVAVWRAVRAPQADQPPR